MEMGIGSSPEALNNVDTAEMWFIRRMIRIGWTEKNMNSHVLIKNGKHKDISKVRTEDDQRL